MIHKEQFRIRTSECNANMKIQPKMVLDLFQEVAARDCQRYNLDSPALIKSHNTGWILSGTAIEFKKHPSWPEKLDIETWTKSLSGFKIARDYSVSNESGENIINGTSIWALLDLDSRRPVKVNDIASAFKVNTGVDALNVRPGRVKINMDTHFDESEITVNTGDIDMNGHVCNIQYVGWLHNNTDKEYLETHELKSLNIAYVGESHLGDELIYKSSIIDNKGSHIFILKESGKEICKIISIWTEV
ncbi:MAG: hypothetical protein B6229_06185 [Spirochaetaceae bacterium 4572_7]|nr:MAG: hypothetical protein B6229_06185 [Spirochaetaceae bacterium 4572_7]